MLFRSIIRRYAQEQNKTGMGRRANTDLSRWGAEAEPKTRSVTINANDISVGVGEAHGSRQPTSEKNPLTQLKAQAGDGVMASVALHENGMGDGISEKKEEKMMVSGVDASVQAKSQTNGTESMTWDKSIDQKEKAVMKENMAPTLEVKNGPFGHMGLVTKSGPLAMVYDETKGWTEEKLGQNNRHWKRLA